MLYHRARNINALTARGLRLLRKRGMQRERIKKLPFITPARRKNAKKPTCLLTTSWLFGWCPEQDLNLHEDTLTTP
jgi:hypothetical protein